MGRLIINDTERNSPTAMLEVQTFPALDIKADNGVFKILQIQCTENHGICSIAVLAYAYNKSRK